MSKDRRSRDQKRKAKLAKKKQQSRQSTSLAYSGEKYRTDELVPIWVCIETAIYQIFVLTDEQLVDPVVASAVEKLILQLRAGTLPPLSEKRDLAYTPGQERDVLIDNIRHGLEFKFTDETQPSTEQLLGVLRSVLGTIKSKRMPEPSSQTYLRYIARFLTENLGVSVEKMPGSPRE